MIPRERKLSLRGSAVPIGARAFDLLLNLVQQRGRVMMKDELMMRVWPGVIVEENNLTVQISALRKVLGAQSIATVPGRGYQLTLEVIPPNRLKAEKVAVPESPAASLALPDKPSVAVLPFKNLSADAQQDYFVEGIVDDIITELSRFRSLFVIARDSTFTYKGRGVDPRTVARELGVRYVLEGSVRRSGQRMRVTAQLVDAMTGSHVWAERYERVVEEVFEVQEEVTQAIVASLVPHIEVFETDRVRVRSGNLSAYELGVRAWGTAQLAFKDADTTLRDEAIRLAREAIALDPNCAAAWRSIASAHWQDVLNGTAASPAQALEEGVDAARRVIAIDGDETALAYKGLLLLYAHQSQTGLSDVRRAHELNPNNAFVLAILGFVEVVTGSAAAAIEHISWAIRLSPRDPWRYIMLSFLGWAYFGVSDYRKAIDAAQASLGDAPSYAPPQLCLVVSLVGLGEVEKAKLEYQALVATAPEFAAGSLSPILEGRDPDYQERRSRFLRMAAGLEDAAAGKPAFPEDSVPASTELTMHGQTHRQPIVLDTLLHGWTYFSLYTAEANARARRTFESAIGISSEPAEAIAMLGWTHWFDSINGWSSDSTLSYRFAIECAAAAVACNRGQPSPHRLQGAVLLWQKQHAAALEHFRYAVELAPNSAYAHFNLASGAVWSGRSDEAMPHLDRALELEPNDNGLFLTMRGYTLWMMGRAEEAKAAFNSAIARNPSHSWPHGQLAVVLAELGDIEAAREAARTARRLNRRFSLSYAQQVLPFRIPVHTRRTLEAWRRAGMPQDETPGGLPASALPAEVVRIAATLGPGGVALPKRSGDVLPRPRAKTAGAGFVIPATAVPVAGSRSAEKPVVLDSMLRGWQHFSHYNAENNAIARASFEAAAAQANEPADAIAWAGWTHWYDWNNGWSADTALSLRYASESVAAALASNKDCASANRLAGKLLLWNGEHERATAQLRHAAALAPDSAYSHFNLGDVAMWSGRCDEALAHLNRAMELDANDHGVFLTQLGFALWMKGELDEARSAFASAITRNPTLSWPYGGMIPVEAELGRPEAAREYAARASAMNRRFSLSFAQAVMPFALPEHRGRVVQAWGSSEMPRDERPGGFAVTGLPAYLLP